MSSTRVLPLLAFYLSLLALFWALLTLLYGISGDHRDRAAIATFNTSSLGLADYHNPTSPLHTNIIALIPSDVTNPASITAYLGVKDWYTMHYFTVCSGYWAPSTSHPSILTTTKIDVSCTRKWSGYTFSLYQVLGSQLLPSVQSLLDDIPTKDFNTNPPTSAWYTGISSCVINCIMLTFAFSGKRKRVTVKAMGQTLTSFVCFVVGSSIVTVNALRVYHSKGPLGPNPYPGGFLALTWLTALLMVLVFVVELMEWRCEMATPAGQPITTYGSLGGAGYTGWFARRQREETELKTYPEVPSAFKRDTTYSSNGSTL